MDVENMDIGILHILVSVNHVPKIHLSVNTPRDEYGLVKGKPKRYFRMGFGKWLTERAFEKKYFSEE